MSSLRMRKGSSECLLLRMLQALPKVEDKPSFGASCILISPRHSIWNLHVLNRNQLKCLRITFFGVDLRKTLNELREKTVSVEDYLVRINEPFRSRFAERMESYPLKKNVVDELRKHADKMFIVVFSAEWCKNCMAHVPVLALLADEAGLRVRVFGGLKKDRLNPDKKWRIPPSPPEVKDFGVTDIPYIIIFNKGSEELGKIVEDPASGKTIEEEILEIIEQPKKREFGERALATLL